MPLDYSLFARWLYFLFCKPGSQAYLIIDRTDWTWEKIKLNFFTLSVAYEGLIILLYWELLNKKEASNTKGRIHLLKQFIDGFGIKCIASVLADREFVGGKWFAWLNKKNLPFYICIKEDTLVCIRKRKLCQGKKAF